ncbi:MAG: hypothetical protein ACFFDN_45565, partial [Candidatus Hodarchaeota archaeon]
MEQILDEKKEAKGNQHHSSDLMSIECDICKEKIKHRATFYQSGVHNRVICEICYKISSIGVEKIYHQLNIIFRE